MLQPLGRHQVGRARHFAGRNRLLLHQVERTFLDDGRLLAQRDAQLQVATLHLTARGHASWDTGRTCTPGWRFWRILFHHVERWTSELVFVVEQHLEEKVDDEQQPEFNPHQSSSATAAGRGGMFLAMRASNSTSSLRWVSNTWNTKTNKDV